MRVCLIDSITSPPACRLSRARPYIVYLHSRLEGSGRFIGFADFSTLFQAHIKMWGAPISGHLETGVFGSVSDASLFTMANRPHYPQR